jgi:hypothetical protein
MNNQELGEWLAQNVRALIDSGRSSGGRGAEKIVETDTRQFHLATTWTSLDSQVAVVTIKTGRLHITVLDALVRGLVNETTEVPFNSTRLYDGGLLISVVVVTP